MSINYHIVMGVLGSGQGSLSRELRDVLVAGTGRSDSAAMVDWGKWPRWRLVNSQQWPVNRIVTRCANLAEANPNLTDVVIQGPWSLDHWGEFSQFPGPVTIYWVDRVDHTECRTKSLNFWDSTLEIRAPHTLAEYVGWLDRQDALWQTITASRDLEWSTWRTFVWDQDLGSVAVVPASSELSYLKQVAVDHFK